MLFHQKQVEYFPIIRNSHTIMQITACFTITTSNAGTKINCRRNRNEVKFESRRNGSRRNGSRQNGSRRNGSRRNGNTPGGCPARTPSVVQTDPASQDADIGKTALTSTESVSGGCHSSSSSFLYKRPYSKQGRKQRTGAQWYYYRGGICSWKPWTVRRGKTEG